MKMNICVIATAIVAIATAGDVFADAAEGQYYFSAMGSYIDDDEDRNIDDGLRGIQFGLGKGINQNWNLEGMFSYGRGDGEPDESHVGFGVDLQRVFMRDERFSPYLHGGVGWFEVDPNGLPETDGGMYSFGVGFYLDMFETKYSLRGEYRHRTDSAGPSDLTDDLYSIGVQLPFGGGRPKWVDSDGDGVSDSQDRCPDTPRGTAVDSYGCELDSDGDGVKDSADKCPDTPSGTPVDASGCPLDSDGDGVTDDKDQCPNTPAGAAVDEKGCEFDSDGDGVVDRLDECPNTPANTPVDGKGCPLRGEYVLRGVNFQTNSDRLEAGASDILNDVVTTLKANPGVSFEVAGHTDSDGAADYNEGLSARRAQTVYDFLAANGIPEDRMSVRGYGESQPIADNSTSAGKAQNRRVSLNVSED